jgi:hypothetical protein
VGEGNDVLGRGVGVGEDVVDDLDRGTVGGQPSALIAKPVDRSLSSAQWRVDLGRRAEPIGDIVADGNGLIEVCQRVPHCHASQVLGEVSVPLAEGGEEPAARPAQIGVVGEWRMVGGAGKAQTPPQRNPAIGRASCLSRELGRDLLVVDRGSGPRRGLCRDLFDRRFTVEHRG